MKNSMPMRRNASPFAPLIELQRDIDRLFGDYLTTGQGQDVTFFSPAVDIEETEDHYLLSLDLPGVNADEISINVEDGQLVVSGTRREEHKEEDKNMRVVERAYGRFERSFRLPSGIDPNKIEASYENGVLRLAIPKAETAKAKQIKVGEGKGGIVSRLLGRGKEEKETERKEERNKTEAKETTEKKAA
jgi:HSP20 family protein